MLLSGCTMTITLRARNKNIHLPPHRKYHVLVKRTEVQRGSREREEAKPRSSGTDDVMEKVQRFETKEGG